MQIKFDDDKKLYYDVNNTRFYPMEAPERGRQQHYVAEKTEKVLQHLESLTPENYVNEIAKCMKSFLYWCDHYCYTFDPRDKRTPYKHFILYPFQREATRKLLASLDVSDEILPEDTPDPNTVLIDKSRDMGASWLSMAIITWCWLFLPSFHAHIGSRIEDLVDDGTPDSLLGKFDIIVQRLPPWMTVNYNEKDKKLNKHMHRQSLTGNFITGEAASKNFGRGPRKNLVYLDEFAFWENDEAVWTAIADTAPTKWVTSTPYGEHNQFAKLRFGGQITVLSLHWSLHPFKDLDWYRREERKRAGDKEAIAQELDIDYKASGGGLALPEILVRKIEIVIPARDLRNEADEWQFDLGMDWGSVNPTSLHVYALHKKNRNIISCWEYFEPSTVPAVAAELKACPYWPFLERIYADPSMFADNQHSMDRDKPVSLFWLFKQLGVHLTMGKRGDKYALEQLKHWWQVKPVRFQIMECCPNQIREFSGLHTEKRSSRAMQKRNESEALVDKDNHSWDDFKYYFNRKFGEPEIDLPQNKIPIGMEALRKDLAALKNKKLSEVKVKHNKLRLFA